MLNFIVLGLFVFFFVTGEFDVAVVGDFGEYFLLLELGDEQLEGKFFAVEEEDDDFVELGELVGELHDGAVELLGLVVGVLEGLVVEAFGVVGELLLEVVVVLEDVVAEVLELGHLLLDLLVGLLLGEQLGELPLEGGNLLVLVVDAVVLLLDDGLEGGLVLFELAEPADEADLVFVGAVVLLVHEPVLAGLPRLPEEVVDLLVDARAVIRIVVVVPAVGLAVEVEVRLDHHLLRPVGLVGRGQLLRVQDAEQLLLGVVVLALLRRVLVQRDHRLQRLPHQRLRLPRLVVVVVVLVVERRRPLLRRT